MGEERPLGGEPGFEHLLIFKNPKASVFKCYPTSPPVLPRLGTRPRVTHSRDPKNEQMTLHFLICQRRERTIPGLSLCFGEHRSVTHHGLMNGLALWVGI